MLSWFKRKKTIEDGKPKAIEQLATLLREHGSTILGGKGKLCLTTQVLISLNRHFQQLALAKGIGNSQFQVLTSEGPDRDISFIFDFVQKTPNLKLVSGPVCVPSPQLCLLGFKSLEVLEIQRVPIIYVRGLHNIAKHIKTLICHRSTGSIKDAVYQFGRDFNGVLTLLELEVLDLSYNTITSLDQSLKLLPSLQNLNLCYNCLANADSEHLPPVQTLNLGFNSIKHVPVFTFVVSRSLTTLVLCNNSLTSLEGLQMFRNLKTLDLSSNCLVSFDNLIPLAQLQYLIKLSLKGNPVEFMPNYRKETLARLSPMARREPVLLDSQVLNDTELLILGMHVEPAPLNSYIPKKPLGRPSTSLLGLANSVQRLSEGTPLSSSTPNGIKPQRSSRRRENRKVREVQISDQSSMVNSLEDLTQDSKSKTQNGGIPGLERQGSFSSVRSAVDASILWIHNSESGNMEVSRSLPDIDYASQLEQEQLANALAKTTLSAEEMRSDKADDSIYSNVPVKIDIDDLSANSGSSISVFSDHDDSPVYLVESVTVGDKDEIEEKESLFVILKKPYLIEKDPVTGDVVKLDLNYLREVVPSPNGLLRVSLKFDLLRSDRKKRLYLFEDMDTIEEFNEFVEQLTPVALKNKQIRASDLEKWQCLKCSTMFQRSKTETSFCLCPNCNSSMVVEQTEAVDDDSKNDSSITRQSEEDRSNKETDLRKTPTDAHPSKLALDVENTESDLLSGDSSIEVLVRFSNPPTKNQEMLIGDAGSKSDVRASSPRDDSSLRVYDSEEPVEGDSATITRSSENEILNANNKIDSKEKSQETLTAGTESPSDLKQSLGKIKAFIKTRLSGSTISVGSSGDKCSAEDAEATTRCTTPSTSYESRSHSRSSKSRTMSPFTGTSSGNIVVNKDELTRCDHRLKLYFTIDLFKMENEDFHSILKCCYARYDKDELVDCLLVISTRNVYILRLNSPESDSAKDWLKLTVKYAFTEIRFIDYGFSNQSFRLEFDRDYGSYKFVVGDSERCNKFLSLLLSIIQEGVTAKQNFPIVMEDPNPRTIANIRTQIFGLKEDLLSLAKRLYEQATIFTIPSLLQNKKMRIRTHQQCVSGKDLITWLVSRREAKSRNDAISMCQQLVEVGLLYHISKELQFEDGDAVYKFDFSDNPKKTSTSALQRMESSSESSQNGIDEMEMNTDVCLYLLAQTRLSEDDSSLTPRTICLTKTHIFFAVESHQWPLSRIYQPPSFLKDQYKELRQQRIIDLVKITYFEDAPCHVMLDFVDELCDSDSRETSWLILVDTLREMNRLTNSLKAVWEEEIKVDLPTEVWPSLELVL